MVSGRPISCVHLIRLCASAASTVQAPLALNSPEGRGQRLVLEVRDDLLDDGVIAMLSLDHLDLFGAVGDEREVTPVGPQLRLRADSRVRLTISRRPP